MPGSRTTLPHTALTLLLAAPLSCSPADEPGQVSDPQGCRTIILPADSNASDASTSTGTSTNDSSTSPTTSTITTAPTTSSSTGSTTSSSTGSTTEPEPYCGDGTVDADEECDDGNSDNSDDCLDTCVEATCGDGFVQDGAEMCDDGNDVETDACLSTCEPASCGDGHVQDGVEECDDGNSEDFDGCTSVCTIERFVFVSSVPYTGNAAGLNGLAGADAKCQDLATKANITANGQTFMAWLSANDEGPATRFPMAVTTAQGPFLLPDDAHTKIANNWEDLTDGTLAHPIDIDDMGGTMIDSTVWTNTQPDGKPSNKGDCSGWTSSANLAKGGIGYTSAIDTEWTDFISSACANSARIYCFQVTP